MPKSEKNKTLFLYLISYAVFLLNLSCFNWKNKTKIVIKYFFFFFLAVSQFLSPLQIIYLVCLYATVQMSVRACMCTGMCMSRAGSSQTRSASNGQWPKPRRGWCYLSRQGSHIPLFLHLPLLIFPSALSLQPTPHQITADMSSASWGLRQA